MTTELTSTETTMVPSEPSSMLTGEWDATDIELSRLSLMHPTMEDADKIAPGSVLLNKTVVLGNGNDDKVPTVVLSMDKYYQEHIDWKDQSKGAPKRFGSEDSAKKQGLVSKWDASSQYNKGPNPYYVSCADAVVLVKVPADHAHYTYEGNHYAKAMVTFRGTAYQCAKAIVTAAQTKNGYPHLVHWLLGSAKGLTPEGTVYYRMILENQGPTPTEFANWLNAEIL